MHAVHAVKSALQALGLDRILPPQVIAWYSLYLGRKTGGPLGVTIKCAGDKLILRKGDRVLAVSRRHSIYATDLALDFDVLHESVEGEKTAEGDVVDFSVPKWHELKGCGKRMYLTAFTEGESLNDVYLKYGRINPGAIVLDLGANCGVVALRFGDVVGSAGRVVALEPDPINFEALQKKPGVSPRRECPGVVRGSLVAHGGARV